MKKIVMLFGLMIIFAIGTVNANAYSTTIIAGSGDYSVGDTVGGVWNVLDYKDAVSYNTNGVWTISGASGGTTEGDGDTLLWFYAVGNYAQVTLGASSTAIAFMLQSDSNDGYVDFSVDGNVVLANYYMQSLPSNVGTLIVSGLANGYHTIKIQSVGLNTADINDFHIYGGAALAPITTPEPTTMLLLGLGLVGLAGLGRKL